MYQPDEHYYIIRRESKLVYFLTLILSLYLNWFWFTFIYAFFACNLLFDDEDEDYIVPQHPDYDYMEELYGVREDHFLFPRIVTYKTLTVYLELVTDLPHLKNWSKKALVPREQFDNYLKENVIFFSLNSIYN